MVNYCKADSPADMQGIVTLQERNLPVSISLDVKQIEGFVSVVHTVDLLQDMNDPYPHILAKNEEGEVVGYTLVMLRRHQNAVPLLVPMFSVINDISYGGKPLSEAKYFVMGQVCVDYAYRKKGVFRGLYQRLGEQMCGEFDYIITEIASTNVRSTNAHLNVGFEIIATFPAEEGFDWLIVLWDISPMRK
jgi:hypothetical protein